MGKIVFNNINEMKNVSSNLSADIKYYNGLIDYLKSLSEKISLATDGQEGYVNDLKMKVDNIFLVFNDKIIPALQKLCNGLDKYITSYEMIANGGGAGSSSSTSSSIKSSDVASVSSQIIKKDNSSSYNNIISKFLGVAQSLFTGTKESVDKIVKWIAN